MNIVNAFIKNKQTKEIGTAPPRPVYYATGELSDLTSNDNIILHHYNHDTTQWHTTDMGSITAHLSNTAYLDEEEIRQIVREEIRLIWGESQ